MPYKILDYKEVSNPIAKKILEEYLSKLSDTDIPAEAASSALDYLNSIPSCEPDKAEELEKKLKELNLRDITVAQIINIRPKTLDELRMLLVFESTVPDEDVLNKILELVQEYCEQEA